MKGVIDVWIPLTKHFITIYYFELYFSLTKHYMVIVQFQMDYYCEGNTGIAPVDQAGEVVLSAKMKNGS